MEKYFVTLVVFHLVYHLAFSGQITTIMKSQGAVDSPHVNLLHCAIKYMAVEYAGFQFDNATGACGPLTPSDIASSSLPNNFFLKIAGKIVYSEQVSELDVCLPLAVIVGAEIKFKIHGNDSFNIYLFTNWTYINLYISQRTDVVVLNTRNEVGELQNRELLNELLTDGQTLGVLVTSLGFELSYDGIYKYTYNHRLSFGDLRRVFFGSPSSNGTMSELFWRLP